MNRKELKKLIQGPIATVPTPFDDDYELDLGRIAELTRWWVDQGIVKGTSVIKVAAAMGEGTMLRDDEWPALLRTVVRAAGDRAAVVCGLHHKDTKRAIEDARRAQDLGAIGLQVMPPIFNLPSQNDLLDFYGDLSDAIEIGIVVYHTNWMPGGSIDTETFLKMADFEQVVAVKWGGSSEGKYDDMSVFAHLFNVIDNSSSPVRCHKLGGRGYVQTTLQAYPPHDLRVWELMEAGRYEEAQSLYESVDRPLGDFYRRISVRSGGQGRLIKGMMAVMGMPVGSSRPPSKPLNQEEMDELRELLVGFGWPVPNKAGAAAAAG
jgi:4-hydroxy-tetrahydrodipicolinate synthase